MTLPTPLPKPIQKFQQSDQIFTWTLRIYFVLGAIISIFELFTDVTILIPILLLAFLTAIYTATFLYTSINHAVAEQQFKRYGLEPLNHEGAMTILALLLLYIPVQAIGPALLNIAFLMLIIFLGEYYNRKKHKTFQKNIQQ